MYDTLSCSLFLFLLQPMHLFGYPVISSTASLSNNQVITELSLVAAFVVCLGTFVAVGI
jgi:hypothetical protein